MYFAISITSSKIRQNIFYFKDEITMNDLVKIALLFFSVSIYAIDKPPIQLAKPYQQVENIQAYFVSEKLDGIRGYWDGSRLMTRSGNIIKTPKFFTEHWPNVALDGEIWLGRARFETTSSIVRKHSPIETEWRSLSFMLFDLPSHSGTFKERVQAMKILVKNADNVHLKVIEQSTIPDHSALSDYLDNIISQGGEGVMLHHQDALYHVGRTANIMKLKPFEDDEAEVIDHIAGKGKYQGKLGAIRVRTKSGMTFKIGSGFTDKERENPPNIGAIVTYKYSGKTSRGVPRFASFLRVRHLIPIPLNN